MSEIYTILLADDDASIRTVLAQALTRAGYRVRATASVEELRRWISGGTGDLVVTDVMFPGGNIFSSLPRLRKLRPELPIIVMSAKNTIMTAISAAEQGAYEYLPKPFDLADLMTAVKTGLEQAKRRPVTDKRSVETDLPTSGGGDHLPLTGTSPAMQDVFRVIARMTQVELTVLLVGESGTGKELAARAIHDHGTRRRGPFVAVNMAAVPRELIESELFGHEKGAFTGATARHAGRFERARRGTLFLDEIGDMPMQAQTRLLRVLQEGEFSPVGSAQVLKTDARIIAATHRDLAAMVKQGEFREDLYFRLNVVPVRLPPLRERLADMAELVRFFLDKAHEAGLPRKTISEAALARLKTYDWPGNVRELENLIQRIIAVKANDEISPADIDEELRSARPIVRDNDSTASQAIPQDFREIAEAHLTDYFSSFLPGLPPKGIYHRILQQVETPLLEAALSATNGNQIRAASLLGINRNTLRSRIRDLGITVTRQTTGDT